MRSRDRISVVIGAAGLGVAVLVIGSALRWTQAAVAVLFAAGLVSQFTSKRRLDRIPPLVVLLCAAIALTSVQLVPFPAWIVDALSPVGSELRGEGAALAGTHPWMCLSLDPAGTLRALCFLIILLGVAVLTPRFAASERGRHMLLGGVAIVCGLAAAVTGLHTLFNADALYGAYEPVHATPPVLGPLLNANHLGCLMAFGAVLSLGLAFYEKQSTQLRVVWITNGLGCVLVALASLSRGAVLGLALGLLISTTLLVSQRMGRSSSRRRALVRDLPIAIVVIVGITLAVFTSAGNVADQINNTSLGELNQPLSKYEAWMSSTELVFEAPLVGVGRGAFEPVFTRVHPASSFVTFSHVENEYVQAVVEWGIPGALLLGLLAVWCVRLALRRWRDGPLAAAAIGALAAVSFQSSVDFGVELLGLAIPVTITLSTLLIVPFRETSGSQRQWLPRGAMIGALLAAAWLLTRDATASVQEDHDDLTDEKPAIIAHLREVIERHPLDYYGYGEYSIAMAAIGDTRAIDMLNHALLLHPTHPGLHRLAARYLVDSNHHSQAAVEFGLALSGTIAPKPLVQEILARLPNAGEAAMAIPADYSEPDVILRALTEMTRVDVAELWLTRVVELPQHDPKMYDTLYDLAMARRHYDFAQRAAELRLKMAHSELSRLNLAKVEFARRDFEPILKDLSDVATWQVRVDEQGEAWLIVCDVYIEQSELAKAAHCLDQLDARGVLGARRTAIVSRLQEIHDRQEAEVKAKALQELEHSANVPDVPIVHTTDPVPVKPQNFPNPLLHPPGVKK